MLLMNLRPATYYDAQAMGELAHRAYARFTELIGIPPKPVHADYWDMMGEDGGWECWVIDGKSGLEASLTLEMTPQVCEIFNIAVDPQLTNQGTGRQLMLFAERRARERGYREISLYTNIKMVSNRAFYARLGYEETGRIYPGGRQAVTMAKRLDGTRMTPMTNDLYAARRAAYRKLHESGCFVQPNPWDAGTARWLRAQGFPALATTSAGFAWTKGRSDMDVPLDMMLGHIAELVEAVPDIPVNADFENGYADDDQTLARNVKLCVYAGVAGLSIEDATGDPAHPLYDFDTALRRIKVARKAVDETGSGVMLTARAEAYLHGHPDPLPEVCKRIAAFAEAGADVLYAPGLKTEKDMREVIAAAGGKPVNILLFTDLSFTRTDIERFGGRRISIGSALAKAAWKGFMDAAELMAGGDFSGLPRNFPGSRLDGFFDKDLKTRGMT
jgi:2-methylisocitrate lyase-like PEP mutase family enzyme/ribosomal protein S18 acetylase RimI-like enzyme